VCLPRRRCFEYSWIRPVGFRYRGRLILLLLPLRPIRQPSSPLRTATASSTLPFLLYPFFILLPCPFHKLSCVYSHLSLHRLRPARTPASSCGNVCWPASFWLSQSPPALWVPLRSLLSSLPASASDFKKKSASLALIVTFGPFLFCSLYPPYLLGLVPRPGY